MSRYYHRSNTHSTSGNNFYAGTGANRSGRVVPEPPKAETLEQKLRSGVWACVKWCVWCNFLFQKNACLFVFFVFRFFFCAWQTWRLLAARTLTGDSFLLALLGVVFMCVYVWLIWTSLAWRSALLIRIGDKPETLEKNLLELTTVLKDDLKTHSSLIYETIVKW